MNIKLNQKIIKDMCGTVSFKRGEAFYRSNKVILNRYSSDICEATVIGVEDFIVTIEQDVEGSIQAKCSCPTLGSFQKDCQHIAAVLLAILEHQRHRTTPGIQRVPSQDQINHELTEGLLTIFENQPTRSSGHQLYFENRKVLNSEFIFKPIRISNHQYMFGVEIKIGSISVQQIREFLEAVTNGRACVLSISFTYDPSKHCFQRETDDIIQKLIQVVHDERIYIESLQEHTSSRNMLLIPPSSWDLLFPLLTNAPYVKLEYDENLFEGIQLSEQQLPLHFHLFEVGTSSYRLGVKGMDQIIMMEPYSAVLYKGEIIQLDKENNHRLSNLIQLIEASGTNQIPIHLDQLPFFLKKVVPGLKELGKVKLSEAISNRMVKTPLVAKLYLDRVKNRLLAGLEFHYENIVINPLENHHQTGPLLIRDVGMENEILEIMEESEFSKTDGGYYMHNEDLEYEFLYHTVPKLHQLVQLYATTAVRNRIFRGSTFPQVRVKVKKERTNWLEFKFKMEGIPDQQIREILSALEEKRKYYRLSNGSLLSLESREFQEIQRFLKTVPVQYEDLENGLRLPVIEGLQVLDSTDDSKVFILEDSFRQFLDTLLHPSKMNFVVPKPLEPILRDYQKQGYIWMKTLASYGFGGVLADDMGLGKTLQSITFILSELLNIRKRKNPVLIVCPSSLTYNWLSELMKFTPDIQAIVVDGDKKERVRLQKDLTEVDVIITSYPLLRKDISWYEKQNFHTVFFDEAQFFKNPVTQTARAVKKIHADHRFALTGTPIENSIEELWSIFHIVFPELFKGLKDYSNLTRKTISRRIRPFLLRRVKEDVLTELPKKIESTETVELLPEQKKLYAAYLAKLRHDTLKHLDKDTIRKNRIKILAGLTRLRQICCHPALFVDGYKGSSAKFEQLMQIIEESKLTGRRVLIFSQFTKMLELIGRRLTLQGLPYFYLDGQTPPEDRIEICQRYNKGERDFFLISLKAGGTGLNLTGADTVILYDLWWNPAVEEQAADRAHRLGQTNPVQVIKLVARGTIEEKMNELQMKKRDLIEELIDSSERSSSSLTEEDIREILLT